MAVEYHTKSNTDGMVLFLDAGNTKSYPGSGTSWYDVSGNANHFTINASAYNSSGPKYMDFNGSYGCGITASGSDVSLSGSCTAILWTRIKNSLSDWRTLFRAETGGTDHAVIVQYNGWLIGMYDNVNSTGFNSSGYSQQSLPGYGTTAWNMLVWRWVSTNTTYPYYSFSYNDTPSVIRGSITSSNARFKTGFRTLGAYNAASPIQFWGDISQIKMYNRYLHDDEITAQYNATRLRYGL
jgi:hypothetical protein